jgi:hypothetical protein
MNCARPPGYRAAPEQALPWEEWRTNASRLIAKRLLWLLAMGMGFGATLFAQQRSPAVVSPDWRVDEVALEQLWPSPFASFCERDWNCSGFDSHAAPAVSTGNRGTALSFVLANETLWAEDEQQEPPLPPKQSSPEQGSPQQPSPEQGSPKHIYGVIPAFNVTYLHQFKPLTPREKFDEWARGTYDPGGLGLYAAETATIEYSHRDGFCGYGRGLDNYGRCFGSLELDANISSFFGDFLFPVITHQDPRYFRLGQGSVPRRVGYAISRVFVTHADSGRTVFFASALSGSVLAAAASNLYYPRSDRGFGASLNHFGIDLADTAAFNVSAEFWPEIKHLLKRTF